MPRFDLGYCEIEDAVSAWSPRPRACGEPAIAVWSWADGDSLKVCREHDAQMARAEEENCDPEPGRVPGGA